MCCCLCQCAKSGLSMIRFNAMVHYLRYKTFSLRCIALYIDPTHRTMRSNVLWWLAINFTCQFWAPTADISATSNHTANYDILFAHALLPRFYSVQWFHLTRLMSPCLQLQIALDDDHNHHHHKVHRELRFISDLSPTEISTYTITRLRSIPYANQYICLLSKCVSHIL